ncbi:MAG: UDP-N-acetylmuramoyl-L-alanine--D-glutamate ligase [Gammaproteobacteria bacterium AqS3]|nr:UDP-N-acetylmuramoyl-L-alanine--D-glutamate ligase [Gammaproteobacteria bacterium AqS3]
MREVLARDVGCAVLGAGVSGSAAVRHLCARGRAPLVVDENPEALEAIARSHPEITCGSELSVDTLAGIGELVVSPGVDTERPVFRELRDRGVRLISEVDLFARSLPEGARVAAVTGTNGKSTVTEMLHRCTAESGQRSALGGNLETAAVELLERPADLYILELSSFQLQHVHSLRPQVACVLNVTADHLDRHGSLERYRNAKHRIYQNAGCAVSNRDDILTQPLLPLSVRQVTFGRGIPDPGHWGLDLEDEHICLGFEPILARTDLKQDSPIGCANAMAVLALADALGLDRGAVLRVLGSFEPLPYRFARTARIGGIDFINDSKATNPAATQMALGALPDGRVRLICGGAGKGLDYRMLRPLLSAKLAQMLALGEQAAALMGLLEGTGIPVQRCTDMHQAVRTAAASAAPGDTVLLSPACSSFDQYAGYAERGAAFDAAVKALAGEQAR